MCGRQSICAACRPSQQRLHSKAAPLERADSLGPRFLAVGLLYCALRGGRPARIG